MEKIKESNISFKVIFEFKPTKLRYCNDLFSRFEQQILFWKNRLRRRTQRRTVRGTTDRRRVSFQNT